MDGGDVVNAIAGKIVGVNRASLPFSEEKKSPPGGVHYVSINLLITLSLNSTTGSRTEI